MKNNRLYVFFGGWIEYTLHPLYEYMKGQGYNCVEITPLSCQDMKKALFELNTGEYVFITSAHVFLDETYKEYKNTPFNLSALEAMDILRPVKSVYYPHDLATLVHDFDIPWLDSIFDTILFPLDGYAHLARYGKPIYNVGWIKKCNKIKKGIRFQVGHALSEREHYRDTIGLDRMCDIFREIWEQGIILKSGVLKDWEQDMNFWEQKNVKYINPAKSIFELIDSCEIILTNALTSVNLESALSGRFTVNMLDGIFDRAEHEKYFNGVPNLKIMTISDTADLLKEYHRGEYVPTQGEDILKPFDFKRAVELITS
jgi:hypothetical protein